MLTKAKSEINKTKYYISADFILKAILLLVLFLIYLNLALYMSIEVAPDEDMRNDIPFWIYEHNTLPVGDEPELINEIWGFSYGFAPYLPSIIAYFFMNFFAIFNSSESSLLLATRLVSVLAGLGSVIFCFKIGPYVFKHKYSSYLLAVIVGFLPQVVFLAGYLNNDIFSLFTCLAIFYFLISGRAKHWPLKSCIGLSVAISACMLTYYFAYGWILVCIPFCIISCLQDETIKNKAGFIAKRALLIAFFVLFLAGWYFIRNAIIYDGDFLGFKASGACADAYAAAGHTLYQDIALSPQMSGVSLGYMLFDMGWISLTIRSFIGLFGYMNIPMSVSSYVVYGCIFLFGLISAFMYFIKKHKDIILNVCLIFTIILPICFSIYQSYTSGFQAQGRYIISALPAIAVWVVFGYEQISVFLAERLGNIQIGFERAAKDVKQYFNLNIVWLLFIAWLILFSYVYITVMEPNLIPQPPIIEEKLLTEVAEDCSYVDIEYQPIKECSGVYFVVCNEGFDIDGLWLLANLGTDGLYHYKVNLSQYNKSGMYTVHIYLIKSDGELEFATGSQVMVDEAVHKNLVLTDWDLENNLCNIEMYPIEDYMNVSFAILSENTSEPYMVDAIYVPETNSWHADVIWDDLYIDTVLAYTGAERNIFVGVN